MFRGIPSFWCNKCLKILKEFTKDVILKRSKDFDDTSTTSKRIAFLDTLLKYKKDDETITIDDIQEEVDTFMFEGHDTTSGFFVSKDFLWYFLLN